MFTLVAPVVSWLNSRPPPPLTYAPNHGAGGEVSVVSLPSHTGRQANNIAKSDMYDWLIIGIMNTLIIGIMNTPPPIIIKA